MDANETTYSSGRKSVKCQPGVSVEIRTLSARSRRKYFTVVRYSRCPLAFAVNLRHDGAEICTSNPSREAAAGSNEYEILMLRPHCDTLRLPQHKCRIAHRRWGYTRGCPIDEDDCFVHSWPQQHRVGPRQSNESTAEQD